MALSGKFILPLAVLAATGLSVAAPLAASADTTHTYYATLNQLNDSGGSGSISISLNGDSATINEHWSGLTATLDGNPFPHVQHIHVGAKGECPPASADPNNDGVVDVPEGAPYYGGIGTTLTVSGDTSPDAGTNTKLAPTGSSTDYHRTIELDAKTVAALKNDTAVVVVHGLNPSSVSKKAQGEKSLLVPSLPLAATAPALCGAVHLSASGGPGTGSGSTAGVEHSGLLAAGGGLVVAAGAAAVVARRRSSKVESTH